MNARGLFITGVDTEIGKTTVAGAIALLLTEAGKKVAVMKPVQSGAEVRFGGKLKSQDALFISRMAHFDGPEEIVSPYLYKKPVSPYHAAREAGEIIDLDHIAGCYHRLAAKSDYVIVEGAGGILAPVAEDKTMGDLARTLALPVLIVSHPFLGAINHTLMTVKMVASYGLDITGVIFSQYKKGRYPDPDFELIERLGGAPVFGLLPYNKKVNNRRSLLKITRERLATEPLLEALRYEKPAARQKRLEAADKQNVWHPFTQMRDWVEEPVTIIASGRGVMVRDTEGEDYLDGFSSYWCNIHGHGEERLQGALRKQAGKISHSTFLGLSSEPAIELAERLIGVSPEGLSKVFYSDNGSTAIEVGVKMAYQHWRHVEPEGGRNRFLSLSAAYHGDTVGAMSVGGVDLYHATFRDILFPTTFVAPPYCYRCPIGKTYPDCAIACANLVEEAIDQAPGAFAAMVIEPIVQCPGGIITAPHGYLKKVAEILKSRGVLMIADEVAVGFGRTGKMFAVEHEEVVPDIMALSKSITSGTLPFAATLATDAIYDTFLAPYEAQKTFFHGHTYTGNQLGAAVACENLKLFKERDIIGLFQEKGAELADLLVRFEDLPHVGDIRQRGLIAGLEMVADKESRTPYRWEERIGVKICQEAKKRGLLIRPLGNVIVLFPAPVMTTSQMAKMTAILREAITTVTGD